MEYGPRNILLSTGTIFYAQHMNEYCSSVMVSMTMIIITQWEDSKRLRRRMLNFYGLLSTAKYVIHFHMEGRISQLFTYM